MKQRTAIHPFTIIVVFICLSIIGIALLPLLPLKLSPSEKMQSINVSFSMRDATSKVVETEVTSRLEALFARVRGVVELRSTSENGYGNVIMQFDKHTDIDAVRFEVATKIRQVWGDLPPNVSFPSIHVNSSDDNAQRPFLVYTVNSLSLASDIQQKVEEVFKTGFSDINEVSAVNITGAEPMEWLVTYDIDKLQQLGITENDILNAISKYRYSSTIGQYNVKSGIDYSSLTLSDIFVALPDSSYISLDRIVELAHKESRPSEIFRINGLNSIYLSLKATDNANQLTLQSKCIERIENLKKRLPSGYEMHKIYDSSEYINAELDKIYLRSGLTILILLLFIAITTLSWRSVFVVVCSLTCNLAIAIIIYYTLGVELQLYSLAGITISLNLIIDNTIIMYDHWRREHNIRVILPICAATLTTIGALSIVFFLDDKLKLNLYDFAIVIMVNLALSLFTALWLVPSLISLLGETNEVPHRRRIAVKFARIYSVIVLFACRFKGWLYVIGILGFGLPLFMLPKSIDSDSWCAKLYNNTLGTKLYQEDIRPIVDVALGGALRIFVQKVYNGSYWTNPDEAILYVGANLPYGCTIEQMDALLRRMESFISQFKGIRQFQTEIYSGQYGQLSIYFTSESQASSFPYILKSNIINKAVQLGGGSWDVWGLSDNGFSNDVRQTNGSYSMQLYGYNYETLTQWADSIKNHLESHKRIKDVVINSSRRYYKDNYEEYYLVPNLEYMTQQNITTSQLFYALNHIFVNDIKCCSIWNGSNFEAVKLRTMQSQEYDIWSLLNTPITFNNRQYKISQLCSFEKTHAPKRIEKINQQYRLCLQYNYIGSSIMGNKISEATDSIYNARMPIGYELEYAHRNWYWQDNGGQQYALLFLVIFIIFIITSILFNSLKLPLIIIGIIPISYIGLFLTFFLWEVNFDQGGFAAFVLLCGITVNASIYIVNETQRQKAIHRFDYHTSYIRAFTIKIVPIMLTILSSILGFVPFIIGDKEGVWYPLAVGTIGGLIFSLIGIFIFLPAFLLKTRDKALII